MFLCFPVFIKEFHNPRKMDFETKKTSIHFLLAVDFCLDVDELLQQEDLELELHHE